MLGIGDTERNKMKSLTTVHYMGDVEKWKEHDMAIFEVCTGAVVEQGKGLSETLLGEDRGSLERRPLNWTLRNQ